MTQEQSLNMESRHSVEGWFAELFLGQPPPPVYSILDTTVTNTKQSRPSNTEVIAHSVKYKSMTLFTDLKTV